MLKPPYTKYSRLYTYHIEGPGFPAIEDPDLIGNWVEDGKTTLVFHKPKVELLESLCRQHNCRIFYQADLDYNDWEMGQEVIPFTVGSLTVAPIWSKENADIRIDPSVVFGNGFHPSTRLCLEALVNYSARLKPGFTALDLGCGTGLLSVGAVWLGASSVIATDYNSLACDVSSRNVHYNNVQGSVLIRQLDLRDELPDTGVDIVMANLHHTLLADLFSKKSFWRARIYLLSGFMPHEEELLLASLPEHPLPFLERQAMDKWRMWALGELK
jgi:ribosomal protein L11 methyltransferase